MRKPQTKHARLLFIALTALGVCGCASAFTSIEPRADGTYTVTRVKQGFFSVSGNVYHCTAQGTAMSCSVIND